jgi:hypothetical protein
LEGFSEEAPGIPKEHASEEAQEEQKGYADCGGEASPRDVIEQESDNCEEKYAACKNEDRRDHFENVIESAHSFSRLGGFWRRLVPAEKRVVEKFTV